MAVLDWKLVSKGVIFNCLVLDYYFCFVISLMFHVIFCWLNIAICVIVLWKPDHSWDIDHWFQVGNIEGLLKIFLLFFTISLYDNLVCIVDILLVLDLLFQELYQTFFSAFQFFSHRPFFLFHILHVLNLLKLHHNHFKAWLIYLILVQEKIMKF